jgi:hypothetical protein
MSGKQKTGNTTNRIEMTGSNLGQLAQGDHIVQMQNPGAVPPEVTAAELNTLRQLLADLKAQVERQAPADKKNAALERVAELGDAITEQKPNLTTMEYVRCWFAKHLPPLAEGVKNIVLHPIVVKLVEAAGDTIAMEFRRRFGGG